MTVLVNLASLAAVVLAATTAVNARRLRVLPPLHATRRVPTVSVLIPARDEAATIASCLESVLASTGIVLEVLVLDDASTDDTAAIVAGLAARDRRVRLLTGTPLPAGWLGKPHACAQLSAAATGTVLAFVDADVVVAPDALARAAALLQEAGLDLVSPYPRQLAVTPAERLVQPLLQWSWLTFLPLPLVETSPLPALSAANGQLLICGRDSYRRSGGHNMVQDAVLDDLELARAFKRAGLRVAMADGTDIATCRMYTGWTEVRDGYSKSLWAVTRRPWAAGVLGAMLLALYVLPPLAALRRLVNGRGSVLVPAAGYAGGVAGRWIAARRTGGAPPDAVAHPLSVAIAVGLGVRSAVLRRRGGLVWKGRTL